MIEFVIDDVGELYVTLLQPLKDKDDFAKGISELTGYDEDRVGTLIGQRAERKSFSSGIINLPSPLRSISPSFSSDGNSYSGSFYFSTDDESNLAEGKSMLERAIAKAGNGDTINVGNALLFMADKVPLFKLGESIGGGIYLVFGKGGTAKRNLSSFEEFETDMGNLITVLNNVTNSFYAGGTPDIQFKLYV